MSARACFVSLALGAALAGGPLAAQSPPGGALYQKLCSQCHGENGDGLGVAAPRLSPKPRDFTAGKFKVRHTPSGALPTDADLEHIIRNGMPYTSMPGWGHLTDAQIAELVAAVKSFSPDFANPERKPTPITIPKAPSYSAESAEKGKQVYAEIGCPACHGELGRGDGTSAPTLKDDWGNPLRPADLTMRWTFRGGPTREDIYRTFTTGLNGTPMPSFAESLSDEQRWQLVDYITSLDPRNEPGYAELLLVKSTTEDLDLGRGEELFAEAPKALFPVVGQITEPGRAFHPAAQAVEVQAVYNTREIAFHVTWHDLRADTAGHSAPDLPVPPEEDEGASAAPAAEEGGFWGAEEAAAPAADAGGDFWGDEGGGAAPAAAGGEFADAVAIQLPVAAPAGNRKPYFLFGDAQHPVDLWFMDLAVKEARRYTAAGSGAISAVEGEDVTAVASYDHGRWSAIFKRSLRSSGGVTFGEGQYLPVAFSIWDGTNRERGNKRALTQWMYLYTLPREAPSPIGPMLRAALAVAAVELLLVFWVRRRYRGAPGGSGVGNPQHGEVQAHV